jgi:hypothetical protein
MMDAIQTNPGPYADDKTNLNGLDVEEKPKIEVPETDTLAVPNREEV